MTNFNSAIRNVLAEVDSFFSDTLQNEKVSKKVLLHRERIVDLIFKLRQGYPELLPETSEFTRVRGGNISAKAQCDVQEAHQEKDIAGGIEREKAKDDFIPELAAKELRTIVKAGFLEKRRKKESLFVRGSYQRRYCVIQNGVMYYYVNTTDKKQAGAFLLRGYKFRKAPYLPEEAHKKDMSFELWAPGKRSYQFLADTTQDFKEWKEAIEKSNDDTQSKEKSSKSPASVDNDRRHGKNEESDDVYYIMSDNSPDDSLEHEYNEAYEDCESTELREPPQKPDRPFQEKSKPERPDKPKPDRLPPEKPKPPVVPKKAIPKPRATSPSTRAPVKPPVKPKTKSREPVIDSREDYVDCESKETEYDDDDDDDDYTEPIDYGRESDDDSDSYRHRKVSEDYEEEYTDVVSTAVVNTVPLPPKGKRK